MVIVFVLQGHVMAMGNLWIANSFTTSPLSVKTSEGAWQSFYCGPLATDKLCTDLIVDNQYGYIWMIVKDVGLVVYDYNQSIFKRVMTNTKLLEQVQGPVLCQVVM